MAAHDDKPAERLRNRQTTFERAAELRVEAAIRELSRTREGREFLWWLLRIGKVGTQPFSSDPYNTAFQCGELNVGQRILDRLVEVEPTAYVQMQQEQLNDYRVHVLTDPIAESDPVSDAATGADTEPARSPDDTSGGFDHPDV